MENLFRFRLYPPGSSAVSAMALAAGLFTTTAAAQFIKEIDPEGNVSYRQDPGYDYSKDESSEENRRINQQQLRDLQKFIDYRSRRPAPARRPPQMTVRTGAAVCNKRISLLKLKTHGCQ